MDNLDPREAGREEATPRKPMEQAPGNFIIGQSFGSMEDHSGAGHLKIRQRIFIGTPG